MDPCDVSTARRGAREKVGTSKLDSIGTETRRSWYVCRCRWRREKGGEGSEGGGVKDDTNGGHECELNG